MNEQFGKNSVMYGKIDPKVVMDLSIFKFGGWHKCTAQSTTDCWNQFMDEHEPWLLTGIPNSDEFFVTQDLDKTCCKFRSTLEEVDVTL